jgi:hypothetical protein
MRRAVDLTESRLALCAFCRRQCRIRITTMPKSAPKKPLAPQPRGMLDTTPDSLPPRDKVLPDDMRRTDEADTAPDSLPRPEENLDAEGSPTTMDGGNPAHPVHDEDIEDAGPEDFEEEIDEAAAEGDVVDAIRRGS